MISLSWLTSLIIYHSVLSSLIVNLRTLSLINYSCQTVLGKMPPGKVPAGNKPLRKIAPRKIAPLEIAPQENCSPENCPPSPTKKSIL